MSFVVGIGASAGGLDALGKFFSNMPAHESLSFVVVQHLSPDYKSMMNELLQKYTNRRIFVAEEGMFVEPGAIYLIPPKKQMTLVNNTLHLSEFTKGESIHLPIDTFLNSLAEDHKNHAIGVILSGTGSDGKKGIISIKKNGGFVLAQQLLSAQFDGMPVSAISTGLVDYILNPEEMGQRLIELVNAQNPSSSDVPGHFISDEEYLAEIYSLISNEIHLDLTYYKQNTIQRRLERRIEINKASSLADYYTLLKSSYRELKDLCDDMLIGVTQFFRDPEVFEYIQTSVIPEIVHSRRDSDSIRIWIAGCSTGEEAYSIAILFYDYLRTHNLKLHIKIFASDIDKSSLDFASLGLYSQESVHAVSQPFLDRYFIFQGTGYKIVKEIRELIVFSYHNIINDPPFNRIDFLSCRNLLIYLQPILQKKVLGYFNFAMNADGYLVLGSSETVGDYASSFYAVQSSLKVFRHKGIQFLPKIDFELLGQQAASGSLIHTHMQTKTVGNPLDTLYKMLVHEYFNSTLVVDTNYNILLVCGKAGEYLSVPKGQLTSNIAGMLEKRMLTPLMTGLRRAFKDARSSQFIFEDPAGEDEFFQTEVHVSPLPELKNFPKMAAISFLTSGKPLQDSPVPVPVAGKDSHLLIRELELDLQYSRENLQSTVEELETSNEELQATNEELLSSNEELQSTNEELQAVNEELITLNSEYQMKINELSDLNNDMDNFLSATNIGVIFLDTDLNIRKYTDAAAGIIHLMHTDVGRSISHFSHNLVNIDILAEARSVLETLIPVEKEVFSVHDEAYIMKVYPYRTRDNFIRGITLTFVKLNEQAAEIIRLKRRENPSSFI